MSEPKQVIVVRKDLNMRKGKIVAQTSHASLGAILNYGQMYPATADKDAYYNLAVNKPVEEWLRGRFKKVCVYVNSEAELLNIFSEALEHGLNTKLIKDAGLTEFNGVPTLTCLAIGPDYPEKIDSVTGHLKLL